MLKKIIHTCEYVSKKSNYVKINEEAINKLVSNLNVEKNNHWLSSNPFNILELTTEEIVNFLVIYGVIDCSFWGNPKWTINTEKGPEDGAFALIAALLNLRKEANHLNFEKISYNLFKKHLTGNVEIPMMKKRYDKALEVSKIINSKMNGNFYEYIKDITNDIELFELIIDNFEPYKDTRTYEGKTIYFYKLAQLLTSDILHIRELKENIEVDYSHLVGCADYKIPQALRALGILEYDKELSNLIDNLCELEENSVYEVEIRANMIIAIKMLKEKLKNIPAIDVNDMIWNLSHDIKSNLKPYHRTRTMSY